MKHISKYLPLAFGAALLAGAASCSRSNSASDDNKLAFEIVRVEQSCRLVGSDEDFDADGRDMSFGCLANLVLPTHLTGKDIAALHDSIISAGFDSVLVYSPEALGAALRRQADACGYALADTVMPDSVCAATPQFLNRFDGFYSIEGDVEALSPRILAYAVTYSTYLPGAAHGMYGTRYINYDLARGAVITLSDIFTADGIRALPQIIAAAARNLRAAIGRTEIDALPAHGNFYITPDATVVFAYSPYEVASYAQGEIQIPIPAYLLAEYLTTEGAALLL